jgi:hypothetical protein
MRAVCWALLGVYLLLFSGGLRAAEQADAKAVLDKALKAMGGADKVAKFSTATVKCKVTHDDNGQQATIVGEGAWQGLDKVRFAGELSRGGESRKILLIINGDAGWMKNGDEVRDAPEPLLRTLKAAFYAMQMPFLLPGLKNEAFTLATQGDQQVDNKDAVALAVNHKDRQEVTVLCDKETGLPVKSQSRLIDPEGKEITVEFFYSDFQEANGVKRPMRILLKGDGKEFAIEISEVEPKDKVDDTEFARP